MQLPEMEQTLNNTIMTQGIFSDTICAMSTPQGVGGIAVARISGPGAVAIADKIWKGKRLTDCKTHTAHLGTITDDEGDDLDQGVATLFRAPASYTGDDVVELGIHGSAYVQRAVINSLIKAGARLAEAGEFTRRAYANGKIDLAQAEAVADVIASESRQAHKIALSQMRGAYSHRLRALRDRLLELASLLELELDFSEEEVEFASRGQLLGLSQEILSEVDRLAASFKTGSAIKQGIPVAIIGPTNAGKSSLLNSLLGDDRAIVSDVHGTTRDIVEDRLQLGGFTFRIMDTAGLRKTDNEIESLGIERSKKAAAGADIVIYVIDSTNPAQPEMPECDARIIFAPNKIDKAEAIPAIGQCFATCPISAKTGEGIDALKECLIEIAQTQLSSQTSVLVTNARHYESLLLASESIARAISGLRANISGDLVAQDIRQTIHHLSSILGQITTPEILSTIFTRFCIGK